MGVVMIGDGREPAGPKAWLRAERPVLQRRLRGLIAAMLVTAWAWGPAADGETARRITLAQGTGTDSLRITLAPTIAAAPAARMPLQISVAPVDALPRHSFLRVRGLPPTISLSEGYATAPGAWSVPLYALSTLEMIVPAGVIGRAEMNVSLVGEDGALLAEARAILVVEPPKQAAAAPPPPAPVAPVPPAPVAPRPPVLSPADREAAEKFVARGEAELAQGNVAMARQFFVRAAQAGLGRGALLLAATHDPRELARWRVQGVQPNLAEARKWYERARELGVPEAEERLAGLGGG